MHLSCEVKAKTEDADNNSGLRDEKKAIYFKLRVSIKVKKKKQRSDKAGQEKHDGN